MEANRVEAKFYHPIEFSELFSKETQLDSDHLTYHIDYFQVKDHNVKKADFTYSLKKSLSPKLKNRKRIRAILSKKDLAFFETGSAVRFFEAALKTPLLIGSGNENIRETGLNIHTVYGIPFIPASSLKGLVRSWAIHAFFNGSEAEAFQKEQSDPQQRERQQILMQLFGTKENQGSIQMHDTFLPDYELYPEIDTVHFSKYYREKGEQPPSGQENTVPIPGYYQIRMTAPAVFSLRLITTHKEQSGLKGTEQLALASTWLQTALEEFGVGAKTAVGNGRFTHFVDVTEEKRQMYQKRKQNKQQVEMAKEQEREKKRQEEKRKHMSEEDQLVFDISQLDAQNSDDQSKSKSEEIYSRIVDQQLKKPAQALQRYWKQTGDWQVKPKKKKQYNKVQQIQKLIDKS